MRWQFYRQTLVVEARKLRRSPVARIATASVLTLVGVTTVGGYAAAMHAADTDMGQKAAALVGTPGWPGYTGLAATSIGITMLLAVGITMAWLAGREFTDGTIVGLFALPPSLGTIGTAKLVTSLAWMALVSVAAALVTTMGGIVLGLPASGAAGHAATILLVGVLLGGGAVPSMWVATRWRGYLPGIAATLALVIVTNVAAGFGLGTYIPWAVPVLWATPGTHTPGAMLALPMAVAAVSAWAVHHAWRTVQLGAS